MKAIAPKIYTEELAWFHEDAWKWYWDLQRFRRAGLQPPQDLPLNAIAPWGRGLAKSTTLEMFGIGEGAILGQVFIVYISSTADKAEEHLQSMRSLIESSEIEKYYPGLARPEIGKFGNQRAWRAWRLKTDSGFSAVAAGLKEGLRGLKDNEVRPTAIFIDDIDERDDSPVVTQEKFDALTKDALPMLAPFGLVAFGQNLIHNQSIMTRTISGDLEWLLHRKTLGGGLVNTFKDDLVIEKRDMRYMITAGTPNWSRINKAVAQDLLDKVALDGFMREAQNVVTPTAEEMVWSGYDETIHVIDWDQFESVFHTRRIPSRWTLFGGYDRGNTGWDRHPAVLSVAAVASEDSPMAGDLFIVYEYSAEAGKLIDDLAKDLIMNLCRVCAHPEIQEASNLVEKSYNTEMTESRAWELRKRAGGMIPFSLFKGSHEALGERTTFNVNWGLPVSEGSSSKTDGLAQLHLYLNPEAKQHPFNPAINKRPNLYLVVDPDQKSVAKDQWGLKRHRWEAQSLKWDRNVTTRDVPTKLGDDATDAVKFYLATFALAAASLTAEEAREKKLDDRLQIDNTPEENRTEGWWLSRTRALNEIQEKEFEDSDDFGKFFQ